MDGISQDADSFRKWRRPYSTNLDPIRAVERDDVAGSDVRSTNDGTTRHKRGARIGGVTKNPMNCVTQWLCPRAIRADSIAQNYRARAGNVEAARVAGDSIASP